MVSTQPSVLKQQSIVEMTNTYTPRKKLTIPESKLLSALPLEPRRRNEATAGRAGQCLQGAWPKMATGGN
jgi:hypothetical protein